MRFLNDLFLALLTAIALAALVFAHAAGAQVPEPQGYSMGPPHGEVPDTPTGARVLGFPGIGKGKLEASLEAYYQEQLRALTGEDPDRQIVFYCHPQCRASWNAAKRVLPFGSASCGWGCKAGRFLAARSQNWRRRAPSRPGQDGGAARHTAARKLASR